jgi:TonB family protein
MKVISFIKISFCLFLGLIAAGVEGQYDTTIYYSNNLTVTNSKSNAIYYSHVSKKDKDNYSMMEYALKNNGWNSINYIAIRKESGGLFILTSKSQTEKNKNLIVKRYFNVTDSGYLIRDFKDTILTQEGGSKLIFPLIKYGTWREYDETTGKIRTEHTYKNNGIKAGKYYVSDNEYIEEPFVLVEKMPQYKGGDAVLLNDISKQTVYPEEARIRNITGTVWVRFVIMNDGSIKGAEVINKVDPVLDEAAIQAVYSLPKKWRPGEQNGKKVNIFYMLPVKFTDSKKDL